MKLHRISALMLRNWYITINSLDRVLDVFFWPVINLFVWGFTSVFVRDLSDKGYIVGFFLGGLILWLFFDRAQKDVNLYILEDFWEKSVYNFYVSPMRESELLISVSLLGLFRAVVEFCMLAGLAFLGYSFNIFDVGFVLLTIFIIPLLIFAWGFGMLISGLVFRLGARVSVLTWSLPFLFQPVSAVFYPLSILPHFLQRIAALLPLAHIFEGFRLAIQGTFAAREFVLALVLSVIYFVLFYLIFLSCVKRSKETGFLSKQ